MEATFRSVRGLFTDPPEARFKVPEYQRGYEWDKKTLRTYGLISSGLETESRNTLSAT